MEPKERCQRIYREKIQMKNFITSKTPLRIGLLGGGSDLESYFEKNDFGSTISASIDNNLRVKGNKEYAFFDCGVQGQGILSDPDNTKRYLSEDFYFCQLWKQCGGQIWADITSELKHIGIKTYERKPILKRHH